LLRLRDPADGLFFDGYDTEGNLVRKKSIHTQTLALLTHLSRDGDGDGDGGGGGEGGEEALVGVLRTFVRELTPPAPRTKTAPSIYWLTYVFLALDEYGDDRCRRDIVAYIRRYWEEMAEHGTTWSQLGEYGGGQSHSHAWSAHPLYHLAQIVGGVRQTAAGWSRIVFRPCFRDKYASVSVPTPHGIIRAHWAKRGEHDYLVELQVPRGISVRIILPGIDIIHTNGCDYRAVIPTEKCAIAA
jgi:hypothetical protein